MSQDTDDLADLTRVPLLDEGDAEGGSAPTGAVRWWPRHELVCMFAH